MINKIYSSKGFQIALPWMLLIIGLGLLLYTTFGTIDSGSNKELLKSIGNAILVGGVFAVLLKSIQFMGVFKEELTKLIYEPKTLENRIDLPEMWEKMSTVLFRNKFPKISDKVLKDVKDRYFPTSEVSYYENCEHEIGIRIKNKDTRTLLITYNVSLDVVCEKSDSKTKYEFGYSKKHNDYKLLKLKVNGIDQMLPKANSRIMSNEEFERYEIPLKGKERHKIELNFERSLCLDLETYHLFIAKKMFHKLKVQIHHDSDVKVELKKMGTITDYNKKKDKEQFKEYICEGIIYPEQGYLIDLRLI
jgi:hypothetical protein